MRLLLDIGLGRTAATRLRELGHDVSWLAEWPNDPGDAEILSRALDERRVLVTIDNDFGELAVLHRQPHCGIIRLDRISILRQADAVREALERYEKEVTGGAIITVEPGRTRIRPAEN